MAHSTHSSGSKPESPSDVRQCNGLWGCSGFQQESVSDKKRASLAALIYWKSVVSELNEDLNAPPVESSSTEAAGETSCCRSRSPHQPLSRLMFARASTNSGSSFLSSWEEKTNIAAAHVHFKQPTAKYTLAALPTLP